MYGATGEHDRDGNIDTVGVILQSHPLQSDSSLKRVIWELKGRYHETDSLT